MAASSSCCTCATTARHGAAAVRLSALQQRAAQLGGSIEVLSLPDQGTEVILKVPGEVCYQTHAGVAGGTGGLLGRTETQG
jgi:signal transduction histidine kinase